MSPLTAGLDFPRRVLSGMLRRLRPGTDAATPGTDAATPNDERIIEQVRPYTMTGRLRLLSLLDAVTYISAAGIDGAFVECGVWRGGSVLAMLLKLQELGIDDRDIYLYDTFEGMTAPTDHDRSRFEEPALKTWHDSVERAERPWNGLFRPDVFNEQMVRELILSSGYPPDRIHFVKGPVEQTIPAVAPASIALLRLDTDWYASTRHELQHLYPRLPAGGVLIIDDYGHWEGCRRAVDEYFETPGARPLLLQRIDYTGRLAIKV